MLTNRLNRDRQQGLSQGRPQGSQWERQLATLLSTFEVALAQQDWDQLASLDRKLQQALPNLRARVNEPAIKAQLQQISRFYATMITAGEAKKAGIQQQITQQASNREGVLAYLQHQ
ncbi:hypothetical protein [Photobacterium nomapromontoriensis]|uniref:hypothetical protein n=1 Tax=Photobacterium nomapromontoriensis TaxID=2910237 RepID=UPI003D1196F1